MTKKHFIALADAIREHNRFCASENPRAGFTDWQIESLARFCASENPNFNRDRWLDYIRGDCGKNGGSIRK